MQTDGKRADDRREVKAPPLRIRIEPKPDGVEGEMRGIE